MPRKKHKKTRDDIEGSPAWMTIFGDLMTLLLVFFVLLYSFSVMDVEKFEGFMAALKNQLGIMEGGKTISEEDVVDKGIEDERVNPSDEALQSIKKKLNQYIDKNKLQDEVKLEMTDRGLVIRLTGKILYDSGKAEIKPAGKIVLDEIAADIKEIENNVAVEGHTDNVPISTNEYPSNWELSTNRAVRVIKYFIEELNMDPNKLSAAGYSKYRPLKANTNSDNRAENRRVEIVILRMENDNNSGSE